MHTSPLSSSSRFPQGESWSGRSGGGCDGDDGCEMQIAPGLFFHLLQREESCLHDVPAAAVLLLLLLLQLDVAVAAGVDFLFFPSLFFFLLLPSFQTSNIDLLCARAHTQRTHTHSATTTAY